MKRPDLSARNFKHGMSATKIHQMWAGMLARCNNKNHAAYHNYGGRGISVCDRWHVFTNFLADMGEPEPGMTIDRINNDGNYEPSNCSWTTRLRQNNNTRRNVMLSFGEKRMSIADWARLLGITAHKIKNRIKYGWTIERILSNPQDMRRKGQSRRVYIKQNKAGRGILIANSGKSE